MRCASGPWLSAVRPIPVLQRNRLFEKRGLIFGQLITELTDGRPPITDHFTVLTTSALPGTPELRRRRLTFDLRLDLLHPITDPVAATTRIRRGESPVTYHYFPASLVLSAWHP